MLDGHPRDGRTSYREFTTAKELERLLADDLAVLLSESFADARDQHLGAASSRPARASRETKLPARDGHVPADRHRGFHPLWESEPEAMEVALRRHDRLLAEVIEEHGGRVVTSRGEGDSFFACFPARLPRSRRPGFASFGSGVRRGLRDCAAGADGAAHRGSARAGATTCRPLADQPLCPGEGRRHGGQVLLTKATRDLVAGRLGGGFGLKRLGEFRLRDLAEPSDLSADPCRSPSRFPPIRTLAGAAAICRCR
jgi:hypothetical protein